MKAMTRKILWFSAGVILSWGFVAQAAAQTTTADKVSPESVWKMSHPQWQSTVDQLKAESQSLLEENQKLTSEYSSLEQKLSSVQNSLKDLRSEVAKQEAHNRYLKQNQLELENPKSPKALEAQRKQKEIADLQTQNDALKKELMDLQEHNRVWETQLSNLQVQKRSLMLDLKLQGLAKEEASKTEDPEVKELRRQLAEAKAKTEDLNKSLASLTAQSQSLPQEIEKIKVENKTLADQVADLDRQRRDKEQENKKLTQENQTLAVQAQQLPPDLVKQKNILDQQIAKLESQFESLRQSVDEAKTVLEHKRQLMEEIMKLDTENQEVRTRITTLMQEISQMKNQPAEPPVAPDTSP